MQSAVEGRDPDRLDLPVGGFPEPGLGINSTNGPDQPGFEGDGKVWIPEGSPERGLGTFASSDQFLLGVATPGRQMTSKVGDEPLDCLRIP